jgi:MFS family permease
MNKTNKQSKAISNQNIIIPSMLKRWAVVLSGSLLFFYSFLQLNILNGIGVYLMRDFNINSTQLGHVSSMYFYANFFLVFPAGLLLDRFSTRRLMLLAMCCAVISMFGFALSPSACIAGMFRLVSGVGGAFCFVSCIRLASRWFKLTKMGLVVGVIVSMCTLGGIVAQTPMSLLSTALGWRYAMMIMGGLGLICFFIMWIMIEDKSPDYKDVTETGEEKLEFWKSIKVVLTNKNNWLSGTYISLMNLPVFVLGALWGNMFLTQVKGLTSAEASSIMSMIFIGMLFGSPLVGWISTYYRRRRLPMIIGAGLSLIIILSIIYIPNLSVLQYLLLFFLLGLSISTQTLGYPLVTELNSPQVTASATSIVAMTLMASGFIFQPLFGWLVDGHHKTVGSELLYSVENFQTAMLILPVGFIVSAIIMLFIKETFCISVYDNQ